VNHCLASFHACHETLYVANIAQMSLERDPLKTMGLAALPEQTSKAVPLSMEGRDHL
jgi:hypothetical protein